MDSYKVGSKKQSRKLIVNDEATTSLLYLHPYIQLITSQK